MKLTKIVFKLHIPSRWSAIKNSWRHESRK